MAKWPFVLRDPGICTHAFERDIREVVSLHAQRGMRGAGKEDTDQRPSVKPPPSLSIPLFPSVSLSLSLSLPLFLSLSLSKVSLSLAHTLCWRWLTPVSELASVPVTGICDYG